MRLQEFKVSFDSNGGRTNITMTAASRSQVLKNAKSRFPLGKNFEARFSKFMSV